MPRVVNVDKNPAYPAAMEELKAESVIPAAGNAPAIQTYRAKLASQPWAPYRMRRIYSGPGFAYRAVEKLATFAGEAEATDALYGIAEPRRNIRL
jgi:transposase-like protein